MSLFPADLFEAREHEAGQWWAMYTMSRQEKSLMRHLHARRIAYYCPIVPHQYRSPAGRTRISHIPLFANYVFIRGTDQDRYAAVSSGRVSRHLLVPDPESFVQQLRSIQSMIEVGRSLTVESQLLPGARVRVKSGPFLGMEGTVLERRSERRLLVAINFLQRGVSVSIGDWETEAI